MKYAFLLLALMFAGCGESSTIVDGYETFTIDGETIQVAKEDFPDKMNWYDAMSACQNLGPGWRLPSKYELEAMYEQLHLKGKGNFRTDRFYWSSSEDYASNAWRFYFENGRASNLTTKTTTRQVRAVRTLP